METRCARFAVINTGRRKAWSVEDLPDLAPQAGEVVIDVKAASRQFSRRADHREQIPVQATAALYAGLGSRGHRARGRRRRDAVSAGLAGGRVHRPGRLRASRPWRRRRRACRSPKASTLPGGGLHARLWHVAPCSGRSRRVKGGRNDARAGRGRRRRSRRGGDRQGARRAGDRGGVVATKSSPSA